MDAISALQNAAKITHVSFELLRAICSTESQLNPKAKHHNDGHSTSWGLCQIKEATAIGFGFEGNPEKLLKADINAYYAAVYLQYQIERYDGDWLKAISAYNAGKAIKGNAKYVREVLNKMGDYINEQR